MYDLPHSYKITDKINGLVYIGICIKKDKNYIERFNEHMMGGGSIRIKELLNEGYTKDDFDIEFIEYYSDPFEASKKEVELIKYFDSYQNGLNGNGGGGFGGYVYKSFWNELCWKLDRQQNDFGLAKYVFDNVDSSIGYNNTFYSRVHFYTHFREVDSLLTGYKEWDLNNIKLFFERFGKFKLSATKINRILTTDKLSDKTKTRLINILLTEDNYNSIYHAFRQFVKYGINTDASKQKQINKNISKEYFDCLTSKVDKEKIKNIKLNLIRKYNKVKNPTHTEGWKRGRDNFRKRVKNKDFTEKEMVSHEKTKNRVKDEWSKRSYEEKIKMASGGLNSMNRKDIICPYCNKGGLTKGNANRWHFNNCKQKELNTL